jgi:glyoxylase-like metal-dependent hydrolase (beta-lactamase superfamily II)
LQIKKYINIKRAKKLGISFYRPNYVYIERRLNSNSIVVDAGCADDPDFSIHVIKKYLRNLELLLITCQTAKENKPNLK